MNNTTVFALADELEKIAFVQEMTSFFDFTEVKEAGHIEQRIGLRAADGTTRLAKEHAERIGQGLNHLHRQYGHVVKKFSEGDTYHIPMPGGLKAIVQKMGDRFVHKTVLKEGMHSTSKGDFMAALEAANKSSPLTR